MLFVQRAELHTHSYKNRFVCGISSSAQERRATGAIDPAENSQEFFTQTKDNSFLLQHMVH